LAKTKKDLPELTREHIRLLNFSSKVFLDGRKPLKCGSHNLTVGSSHICRDTGGMTLPTKPDVVRAMSSAEAQSACHLLVQFVKDVKTNRQEPAQFAQPTPDKVGKRG